MNSPNLFDNEHAARALVRVYAILIDAARAARRAELQKHEAAPGAAQVGNDLQALENVPSGPQQPQAGSTEAAR